MPTLKEFAKQTNTEKKRRWVEVYEEVKGESTSGLTLEGFCEQIEEITGQPFKFEDWESSFDALKNLILKSSVVEDRKYNFKSSAFSGAIGVNPQDVKIDMAAHLGDISSKVPGTKFEFWYEHEDGNSERVEVLGDHNNYASHTFTLTKKGVYWLKVDAFRLHTPVEQNKYGLEGWVQMNSASRRVRIY